jgi:putative toxin-antitoxin system antitoxin component (TIGR02293 family)
MPAATRARIRNFSDLRGEVTRGLRFAAVHHLSDFVTASGRLYSAKLVARRIGPAATLTRRKATGRLTPDESERAARLARVMATAVHVLGNDDDARAYMTAPSRDFAGQKPIDVAADELGAREVENVLWQIYYGMSA